MSISPTRASASAIASSVVCAPVSQRTVNGAGGRTIAIHEGGDPHGRPVLFHHGTPSDGRLFAAWDADAAQRGIHLIGYDRAGYGGSDRDEGRSVASVAFDAEAIADALGIERFATY